MLQDHSLGTAAMGPHTPGNPTFPIPGQAPMQGSLPASTTGIPTDWAANLFDPGDPTLFNFDLASMNFGNQYGALEFGMLGQMASGAGETPPSDAGTQRGSVGQSDTNSYPVGLGSFAESPTARHQYIFNDSVIPDWPNSHSLYNLHRKSNIPHAFAIETNNANFMSPENENTPPDMLKFEESPVLTTSNFKPAAMTSTVPNPQLPKSNPTEALYRDPMRLSTPQLKGRSQIPVKSTKRPRDPSSIYTSVTAPYPYTAGFHSLIAYLQRRFASTPAKTLAIAKSLASIRPSFIATTKTLNRDDLIFMEQCFQRTLWEYEGFIESVGTPTIIARRTGEIAAVGKEFQILTGWQKNVLLGRAPNLNVNRGRDPGSNSGLTSGANTAGRGTGTNTPTLRALGSDPDPGESRPQPVFLAEFLDDDSVVTFYEDFARLAFGDSRGSIMGRCKLLKYRTKDDEITQNLKLEKPRMDAGDAQLDGSLKMLSSKSSRVAGDLKKEGIAGERGMQNLGAADGKVECTYCWTVKRDVFDIPMFIVMNVRLAELFPQWRFC